VQKLITDLSSVNHFNRDRVRSQHAPQNNFECEKAPLVYQTGEAFFVRINCANHTVINIFGESKSFQQKTTGYTAPGRLQIPTRAGNLAVNFFKQHYTKPFSPKNGWRDEIRRAALYCTRENFTI
jgi:hypothetical protein